MASSIEYQNQAPGYATEAKRENAFDSLSFAVSNLRDLQKTARSLADKLTGSAPPEPSNASGPREIAGGGLIDGVERQTTFIREIHADIYASLSRIENRL